MVGVIGLNRDAAAQLDLEAGDVGLVVEQSQPAKVERVEPDDPQVGHRALGEVELAVGTEGDHARLVVAGTGKLADHNLGVAASDRDPHDLRRSPADGDVQVAVVIGDAVDRRSKRVQQDRGLCAVEDEDPAAARSAAERQPRFADVRRAVGTERQSGREVQAACLLLQIQRFGNRRCRAHGRRESSSTVDQFGVTSRSIRVIGERSARSIRVIDSWTARGRWRPP